MTKENMNINEILNDSELDQVVGGFAEENYSDMTYLKEQCGIDLTSTGDYNTSVQWLADNYASAGIGLESHDKSANRYFDLHTGKQVSHNSALATMIDYAHSRGRWG